MLSYFNRVLLYDLMNHQAPLSMGFSKKEYWSGLPFSSSGDLPDTGIEPWSLKSPALAGGFFTNSATWESHIILTSVSKYTFFSHLLSKMHMASVTLNSFSGFPWTV